MAISFKNFLNGIGIVPKGVSESTEKGDIEFLTTNDKLHIFNGSVNDPIVSETIAATLENKTLDAPVINDATADTITGIAGGALTIQSASNQNLSLQAQGSGVISLESLTISGSSISNTGGSITIEGITINGTALTEVSSIINSAGSITIESIIIDGTSITDVATISNSAGDITIEGIIHSSTTNSLTGGAATFLIQSASNQNLSLQAQGSGSVLLESITISGATITGATIAAGSNTISGLTNSNLSGSAGITNANLANSSITINGSSVSLGGSVTVTATATNALTIGTGLSGTSYNGSAPVTITIDSTVVTLTGSQSLSNKTLTSPVLNTPTADTITGIAGGALTIQSASNQNLSLQAQGSGVVTLESLTIDGNTITGGASQLSIYGANNQDVIIRASGTGEVYLQKDSSTVAFVDTGAFILADNSELRLRESSGSGSNYIGIKAPSTLSGDYSITLPSSPPSANDALVYNGSAYVWSSATTIADGSVTNAKLADMAQSTIKGRAASAGTGAPTDLTAQQVKDILYTSPTVQRFTSGSGTYTTPANVKYIRVKMVGGGAGGVGSGTAAGTAPTAGNNSTFGSSLLTANGGGIGSFASGAGGAGGSVTVNSPAVSVVAVTGGDGGNQFGGSSQLYAGGDGGNTYFTGSGKGGHGNAAGSNGKTNSGGGGGGGGISGVGTSYSGPGGGAGGYIEAIITGPSSTYSYAVGSGGNAGGAGSSGQAGGAGAAGIIIVEEYYY